MDMPNVMRTRRADLGMSQADLARRADVAVRQIARYEAGEQQPALNVAQRMAAALQISLDELAGAYTHLIDLSGEWCLARRAVGVDAGEADVVKIHLAQRGYRISLVSEAAESELDSPNRLFGELRLIDADALRGSYTANERGEQRSGTLLLALEGSGLGGKGFWAEISRPTRRIAHGVVGLARSPEEAEDFARTVQD